MSRGEEKAKPAKAGEGAEKKRHYHRKRTVPSGILYNSIVLENYRPLETGSPVALSLAIKQGQDDSRLRRYGYRPNPNVQYSRPS